MNIKISELNNNIDINNLNKNKNKIDIINKEKIENTTPKSEVDISFMNQLKKLKNESINNQEQISKLKSVINKNQYSIDIDRLSSKIIDFEIQLQKLKD
jgi:anti-sigma28 factor (negative regulator of flagellin synthesis)